MLQNEYLVAKIGLDDVDNEPLQVWGVIHFNIQSGPYSPFSRFEFSEFRFRFPLLNRLPWFGKGRPAEFVEDHDEQVPGRFTKFRAVRKNGNLVGLEKS